MTALVQSPEHALVPPGGGGRVLRRCVCVCCPPRRTGMHVCNMGRHAAPAGPCLSAPGLPPPLRALVVTTLPRRDPSSLGYLHRGTARTHPAHALPALALPVHWQCNALGMQWQEMQVRRAPTTHAPGPPAHTTHHATLSRVNSCVPLARPWLLRRRQVKLAINKSTTQSIPIRTPPRSHSFGRSQHAAGRPDR